MSAVEIDLPAGDLSKQMAAMRIWLDQRRFEPSSFSCCDNDRGMRICVAFSVAYQAEAFAKRFGGRADARTNKKLTQKVLKTRPADAVVG
jgi:hypothetical protein